jgi:hypothetical protein
MLVERTEEVGPAGRCLHWEAIARQRVPFLVSDQSNYSGSVAMAGMSKIRQKKIRPSENERVTSGKTIL